MENLEMRSDKLLTVNLCFLEFYDCRIDLQVKWR